MSYRFIRRHEQAYSVGRMCMLLRICRSSYYAWKKRKPSQREQENQALIEHIRRIHKLSCKTYGSPRVYAQLRKQGWTCSKKRIARLIRIKGGWGMMNYVKKPTIYVELQACLLKIEHLS